MLRVIVPNGIVINRLMGRDDAIGLNVRSRSDQLPLNNSHSICSVVTAQLRKERAKSAQTTEVR